MNHEQERANLRPDALPQTQEIQMNEIHKSRILDISAAISFLLLGVGVFACWNTIKAAVALGTIASLPWALAVWAFQVRQGTSLRVLIILGPWLVWVLVGLGNAHSKGYARVLPLIAYLASYFCLGWLWIQIALKWQRARR